MQRAKGTSPSTSGRASLRRRRAPCTPDAQHGSGARALPWRMCCCTESRASGGAAEELDVCGEQFGRLEAAAEREVHWAPEAVATCALTTPAACASLAACTPRQIVPHVPRPVRSAEEPPSSVRSHDVVAAGRGQRRVGAGAHVAHGRPHQQPDPRHCRPHEGHAELGQAHDLPLHRYACVPSPFPSAGRRRHASKRSRTQLTTLRPSPTLPACGVGDPTIFGNFKAPETATTALVEALHSFKYNGYPPAHGYESARAAVARMHTRPSAPVTPEDVIIASGCSGAIELAITVLANPGQNILMPRPGFSLYQVICDAYKVETRFYDLVVRLPRRMPIAHGRQLMCARGRTLVGGPSSADPQPERSWEISLSHLESLIDDNTACVIVNNPSNPCGSVFSEEHLRDLLARTRRRGRALRDGDASLLKTRAARDSVLRPPCQCAKSTGCRSSRTRSTPTWSSPATSSSRSRRCGRRAGGRRGRTVRAATDRLPPCRPRAPETALGYGADPDHGRHREAVHGARLARRLGRRARPQGPLQGRARRPHQAVAAHPGLQLAHPGGAAGDARADRSRLLRRVAQAARGAARRAAPEQPSATRARANRPARGGAVARENAPGQRHVHLRAREPDPGPEGDRAGGHHVRHGADRCGRLPRPQGRHGLFREARPGAVGLCAARPGACEKRRGVRTEPAKPACHSTKAPAVHVPWPFQCFHFPGYFRIVFTPPKDKLAEAYDRLEAFCAAHHV